MCRPSKAGRSLSGWNSNLIANDPFSPPFGLCTGNVTSTDSNGSREARSIRPSPSGVAVPTWMDHQGAFRKQVGTYPIPITDLKGEFRCHTGRYKRLEALIPRR